MLEQQSQPVIPIVPSATAPHLIHKLKTFERL
jgi:hypothetical protein